MHRLGNHDVRDTTDNTLRVLELLDVDVPVVPGLNGPYAGRRTPLPSGRDDIPTTLDLPAPTRTAHDGHAPDWLAATLAARPGEVAVVATGPLSNLAAAVTEHPEVVQDAGAVVCLVGTHEQEGVAPLLERNAWCDPEAVRTVLAAGFGDLTLVTMDATFSAPLDAAAAASLRGSPAGDAAAAFQHQRIGWYAGPAPLHDPLAVAAVVEPDVLHGRRAAVEVDVSGEPYGRTVFDWSGDALTVATSADPVAYLAWLRRVLGAPASR